MIPTKADLLEVVQVAVTELRKLGAETKAEIAPQADGLERAVEGWVARVESAGDVAALTALVQHEAAHTNAEIAQYGQLMTEPDRRPARALAELLERRGVLRPVPPAEPHDDTKGPF